MPPSVGPRMPIYPPGGPGIGQQMFYGQAPPTMIPPQVFIISLYFKLLSAILPIGNSLIYTEL